MVKLVKGLGVKIIKDSKQRIEALIAEGWTIANDDLIEEPDNYHPSYTNDVKPKRGKKSKGFEDGGDGS